MEFIIILLIIAFCIVILPILVLYFTGTLKLTEDEETKKDKAVDTVKEAWTVCANKTIDAYNIVRPKVKKTYIKLSSKILKKELDEEKINEIEKEEADYAKLRNQTKIEEKARRDRMKDKEESTKNLKDVYLDFFKTKSMSYKNVVLGFKIATLIIILLGIVLAFYISITQKSILAFFITLFVTAAIALVMYIVSQVIDLLVKIEKNTRKKSFVSNFDTYYHKDEKDEGKEKRNKKSKNKKEDSKKEEKALDKIEEKIESILEDKKEKKEEKETKEDKKDKQKKEFNKSKNKKNRN